MPLVSQHYLYSLYLALGASPERTSPEQGINDIMALDIPNLSREDVSAIIYSKGKREQIPTIYDRDVEFLKAEESGTPSSDINSLIRSNGNTERLMKDLFKKE
jgi:hypothetical protein